MVAAGEADTVPLGWAATTGKIIRSGRTILPILAGPDKARDTAVGTHEADTGAGMVLTTVGDITGDGSGPSGGPVMELQGKGKKLPSRWELLRYQLGSDSIRTTVDRESVVAESVRRLRILEPSATARVIIVEHGTRKERSHGEYPQSNR